MSGQHNKPQSWWFAGDRWFNLVAGVLGIAGWIAQGLLQDASYSALLNLFIIVALIAALFGLAYFRWQRERYAEITPYLEAIAETCRIARARISGDDLQRDNSKFSDDLRHVMDDVANVFSILRGTRCRCALKTFHPIGDFRPEDGKLSPSEWCVITTARDSASSTANKNSDRARADVVFDTLDKNPHLLRLFSDEVDGEDWECFEDIPRMVSRGQYASSSQLWQMNRTHAVGARSPTQHLPYKSALIALVYHSADSVPLAFIGVDCLIRKGFVSRYDGPLLTAIAGLISPLLEEAWKLTNIEITEDETI